METISGNISAIKEEQTFGTFTKKEIWVETELESKYPQMLSVEFTQDNIAKLSGYKEGDTVEININLRGRYHEGTDKVYNTITGWKIQKIAGEVATPPVATNSLGEEEDSDDSVPF